MKPTARGASQGAEARFVIGRPQVTEAAPYYFTYINQIAGDDPIGTLESQLGKYLELFSMISEEKSLHSYAPEKWTIRQVVNHITDTERVTAFRALWFARGFESPLPSYDQQTAVSGARAGQIPWAAHAEEFGRVRLATISLFRNMPSEGWEKSGIASDNRFTVRALAYIVVGHCQHHVALLCTRYL